MALPEIPEEVLIHILIRLPVKSLMRFKSVSRIWLSLITSRYFTNLHLKPSSHRRVFLYAKTQSEYALLTSSTHDHSDTTSVSVFDQDWTIPGMGEHFLNADRGLVCFQAGTRVRIGNLNTRQLVELPIVINSEGKGNDHVLYYLGHDPVHDEYKVLSIVWELDNKERRVVRSEHRVLVLGAGASWKKTKCHITHRPHIAHYPPPRGISINGVLYYGAWTNAHRYVLMSFDLNSEEFNFIELPYDAGIYQKFPWGCLMNYKGKVAVFDCISFIGDCIINVWVVEDANKSQWSDKKSFVFPTLNFYLGDCLAIDGTCGSGKVCVRKIDYWWSNKQPSHFYIYDLERNEITRRTEITRRSLPGSFKDSFEDANWSQSIFWDDVESIMYLEI